MRRTLLTLSLLALTANGALAQLVNQFDDEGNFTQYDESGTNRNFNKHNKDTTSQNKEIPKGLHVWRIDRRFGDRTAAEPDTLAHLFPNNLLNTGRYGEYNTVGNNYTARQNRIVIDRPLTSQFVFTQPYSWVTKEPDQLLFTNTLSPITNITYDNCGDKTNGEDHIDAMFAVNAGKRLGFGFDLNYAYARGYYANQSASHFAATLFASYIGDRYQMHAIWSNYHQKATENGGITDDDYIRHPESFDDSYRENEIPTVLESNWNRNDNMHFFLSHRYNIGFYRMVKLTEEELKARQFASESKKQHANDPKDDEEGDTGARTSTKRKPIAAAPVSLGRPDGATIAGDEPVAGKKAEADTTRISVDSQAKMDSLLAAKAMQDSINATMKREYVPVTSIIHTLDINRYNRIYQAYATPADYYANSYYNYTDGNTYGGDSIYDQTRHLSVKNTVALAMLEGFNKWAKAGLKLFASHEWRRFELPELNIALADGYAASLASQTENSISVGAQIIKSQGHTLHYNLAAETWVAGEDFGQLKIDFNTDLNFRLWGDTVTLAAKAYFYRLHPTFYQRHYHGKHFWWDNDLSAETRTRIEGLFNYRKTNTTVRVAVEEIQNYTYLGTSYAYTTEGRTNLAAGYGQFSGNINLLTLQLQQNFRLGILNWENIITYQNSNQEDILPVPALNVFTNLYLKFKIAKVLSTEFGFDAYYFTKYYAPDFVPQLNQFAVQTNEASRVKVGGYPFVDAYINMHLKHARFFVMFSHVNAGYMAKDYFLTPHYPQNSRIFRVGISWNFFN